MIGIGKLLLWILMAFLIPVSTFAGQFKVTRVYDGDTMAAASAGQKMYFLNTKYLKFRPHSGTNFTALDQRAPTNQDANVVPMVFAGNLTVNQRRAQGVIATA